MPGLKRNRSQVEREGLPKPPLEVNPSACPISWTATASKSNLSESIPSSGLKSNPNLELKPIEGGDPNADSATGSATGLRNPRARKTGEGDAILVTLPISVG